MEMREYVSSEDVRKALRVLYREDQEINLQNVFLRVLADDLKPRDEKGRWRPNFLVILLCAVALILSGVFLYFSFGAHP